MYLLPLTLTDPQLKGSDLTEICSTMLCIWITGQCLSLCPLPPLVKRHPDMNIVRSVKRCRRCILRLTYYATSIREFENLAHCTLLQLSKYSRRRGFSANPGTVASNRQNTSSLQFNDGISLLTQQYNVSLYPFKLSCQCLSLRRCPCSAPLIV